jgi:hypothetical protein
MSASLSAHAPITATAGLRLALVAVPFWAIRVVVAHQHRLVHAGLRALLEQDTCITVVGEAASGLELEVLGRRVHPDVVVSGLPALVHEPQARAGTLVVSDELADARAGAPLRAVKGVARRRPQPRTLRLKLIQGGSPWNSVI